MIDRRKKNAEIFSHTQSFYSSNLELKNNISLSIDNQVFISEKSEVVLPKATKKEKAQIIVSGKRTFEAAEHYVKQGKKTCVLNFASATNAGGGVVNGSSAQEECLCRCSTLYPCLRVDKLWKEFYLPHREANNPLYNNDCIYTPDVYVFKSDIDFPELLSKNEWWKVNILTCAAPNLREKPSNAMNPNAGSKQAKITIQELEKLLESRIRRIFEIAASNENEVLILGAFGCGAFRNPPEVVAKVFNRVMKEFVYYFDIIEYAVFHRVGELANYEAFQRNIER